MFSGIVSIRYALEVIPMPSIQDGKEVFQKTKEVIK